VDGPDDNYKFTGWLSFSIKSGLTSSNLTAKGHKEITFKDGQKIRHNYFDDIFYNILMGTLGHQLTGTVEYVDEANDIVGTFTINPSRWLAQDAFTGEIKVRGEKVSDIKGNYMGYFDIDGVRYWDIRDKDQHFTPVDMKQDLPERAPSDAIFRADAIALRDQPIEEAQTEKERLEVLQRHDRKLRADVKKRRDAGGPKHVIFGEK